MKDYKCIYCGREIKMQDHQLFIRKSVPLIQIELLYQENLIGIVKEENLGTKD